MKFQSLLIYVTLTMAISGCALLQYDSEVIHVPDLDLSNWDIGYQKDFGRGNGYIREWVPKGESINSWSQLLSIQFVEGIRKSPFDYAAELSAKRKEQCPGTNWSELKRDENTIYYKFSFPDCAGQKAQLEVTRLFRGNDGLHRLSYTQKGTKMDEDKEKYYLHQFGDAFVAKGSPKNRLY